MLHSYHFLLVVGTIRFWSLGKLIPIHCCCLYPLYWAFDLEDVFMGTPRWIELHFIVLCRYCVFINGTKRASTSNTITTH